MTINSITPTALYERINAGEAVDLIDVRSPREYGAVHAVGARSMPLDTLSKDEVIAGRRAAPQQPVYVICHSGSRSLAACDRLVREGLDGVVNVEGGTMAWQSGGLPVEGSGRSSTAKWLRVTGLLGVALSLILGITWKPVFAVAAAGIWMVLVVTGNAPCCSSRACSTGKTG